MTSKTLFIACALILLATLHASAQGAQQQPRPLDGRYQIVMSPHNARDTFLLDTDTGRVYQLTVLAFLNGEPGVWKLMPRIDVPADEDRVVEEYGRKRRAAPNR